MEKADLRPLILQALRQEPETTITHIINEVEEHASPKFQTSDRLKVSEIVWELLVQGVLCPGPGTDPLQLSHAHLTEYGRRCLETDDILPHDPDGYLQRLKQRLPQPLDDIVETYTRESLLTFLAGHCLAATVMLGVASERCIDLLIEAYSNAITDAERKASFDRKIKRAGRSIKRRFDPLRGELLALTLPPDLKETLDIQLSGIFTLIRRSRNEAGHPTGMKIDRDEAHANLLLFPHYCKVVHELINHFQSTPV